MKPRLALTALLLAIALLPAVAFACPNCADTVSETDAAAPAGSDKSFVPALPTKDLANSFNYSIYLMLAVPYTLLIVGGFVVYRVLKKADSKMLSDQADLATKSDSAA